MIKSLKSIVWLFFSVLVAALGSCGCASKTFPLPREYQVHISPHMKPEQTQAVLDALDSWQQVAVVHFDVTISNEECGYTLIPGARGGCIFIAYTGLPDVRLACDGPAVGCTTDQGTSGVAANTILSDALVESGALHAVVMHEIGHALGLHHTGPGTLMCRSLDCDPGYVTQEDVGQYESYR
jgi:hypothetical protein